jgi:LEA14-like dessication related protein
MRSPGRPVLPLLALLAGCATLRDISAASFVQPSIAWEATTADGLDQDGVTVVIHLRVDNPNPTALRLARLGYELEVEGRPVASGSLSREVGIPASGSAPVAVPIRVGFREIPGALESALVRGRLAYRARGSAGIATPMGTIDLPFDQSGEVALRDGAR